MGTIEKTRKLRGYILMLLILAMMGVGVYQITQGYYVYGAIVIAINCSTAIMVLKSIIKFKK